MGVIYWEPAWISSKMKDLWGTGSSWENCAFFNFSGNASEVLNYLSYEYSCRGVLIGSI
ncbi:MAG: glycosyl hydrolase 53 family protein [Marinilabiliaceae bacterium]